MPGGKPVKPLPLYFVSNSTFRPFILERAEEVRLGPILESQKEKEKKKKKKTRSVAFAFLLVGFIRVFTCHAPPLPRASLT